MNMIVGLREAAVVADVSAMVIRHSIKQKIISPRREAGHLRFSMADVLFFALRDAIPFAIEISDQRALRDLMVGRKLLSTPWAPLNEYTVVHHAKGVSISFDFRDIHARVQRRLQILAKRAERIESRPDVLGGEPVFVGTRISVQRVGRLMQRKVALEELKADFPRLREDDFELARLLVSVGRGPGRPTRARPLRIERAKAKA